MHQTDSLDSRIRAVFHRLFKIAPEKVSDQTRRGALETWDSLGHLELLDALRAEFHVEIPPDQALDMETYADVRRVLAALLPA